MAGRLALVAALTCAACTVDAGVTPDAGACAAPPDFFVSDVWPRYLVPNQCANRGCHDFDNGHGTLRLHVPESPPAPGLTLDAWPVGWRENYLSAIQLLDCAQPTASRLLTYPEGQFDLHPPGPVVRDRATAAMVMQTWVMP